MFATSTAAPVPPRVFKGNRASSAQHSSCTQGGSAGGDVAGHEITEWTVSADLKNEFYQFRTYDNSAIRQVSLRNIDLDAKDIRYIPVDQPASVTDMSK